MEGANNSNQNLNQPCDFNSSSISYLELQLANPELWNGQSYLISIFITLETICNDLKNIKTSLYYIVDFIKNRNLKSDKKEDISSFISFG